ncbi:u8-agatoxin-Ao1a [Nephila pilipes]|uniref:U8-agatoxin-Ao1a n=1 Tax=Nephila pilipes TaxID=299642 RepID=A0A8X6U7W0_NEPPI|nr:u8-agatoxin-Ao1a [Nephila pilipes]
MLLKSLETVVTHSATDSCYIVKQWIEAVETINGLLMENAGCFTKKKDAYSRCPGIKLSKSDEKARTAGHPPSSRHLKLAPRSNTRSLLHDSSFIFVYEQAFLTTFAMKYLLFATLAVLLFVHAMAAVAYPPPLDRNLSEDYNDNNLENFLGRADKRGACIRRGGGCDGKPNDCCANSSCRCNLWGTNCRCERAGLFQQWGK